VTRSINNLKLIRKACSAFLSIEYGKMVASFEMFSGYPHFSSKDSAKKWKKSHYTLQSNRFSNYIIIPTAVNYFQRLARPREPYDLVNENFLHWEFWLIGLVSCIIGKQRKEKWTNGISGSNKAHNFCKNVITMETQRVWYVKKRSNQAEDF